VFLKIRGDNSIAVILGERDGILEDIGMGIPFGGNHFTVEGITDIVEEAEFFIGDFDEVKALVFFSGGIALVNGAQSAEGSRELGLEEFLKRIDKGIVIKDHKDGLRFQPVGNILKVKAQVRLERKSIGNFIIVDQGLDSEFTNRKDVRELSGGNEDRGIRVNHDKSLQKEKG
jgi:hypothetical protein